MQRFSKAGGRSVSLWGAVGGTVLGSLVWSACAELPTNPEIAASTIPSGHSHNDYLREEPLWEALENGIPSVEVDVYRVGPILLVGHDTGHLRMERTLRSLYLEPLHELVQQRGDRIFDDGHPLTLLIDIKSEAAPTYGLLRQVLAQYGDMLTEYRSGVVTPRP
ncbi:MAG: hypothetical protein R3E12_10645 [Candidatus Eisenbacteria bacterium]